MSDEVITINSDELRAVGDLLLKKVSDPGRRKDAFTELGVLLKSMAQTAFKKGSSPEGEEWPELAESTIEGRAQSRARRRAKETGTRTRDYKGSRIPTGGAKPLRDSGALAKSLLVVADDSSAELYTSVPYAKYHQAPTKRGRPPRRPFIPEAQTAAEAAERVFGKYADNIVKDL